MFDYIDYAASQQLLVWICCFRVCVFLCFCFTRALQMTCYLSHLMTKPTKWSVRPAKTQVSPGIRPVWSVFAVCMKKPWVLSCSLSAQRRLIRLGGYAGWCESSLGAQIILLVLSCCSSNDSLFLGRVHFFFWRQQFDWRVEMKPCPISCYCVSHKLDGFILSVTLITLP